MADQVGGLRELRRALKQLPKDVRKKVLTSALRSGAKPIQAMAKALVPTGESVSRQLRGASWDHYAGKTRDSIKIASEKKKFLLSAAKVRIGVDIKRGDKDGAWWWRFVEFGTKKQAAKPFLVPAFESMKFASSKIIKSQILKGIDRAQKRLGRRK